MKTRMSAVLLALSLAAGSGWAQDKAAAKPQFSGFLGDYSKLQPAKDREGTLLFINKSQDYKSYTKVMFDSVEVYLTPNPNYKGLQPDTLKRMTDNVLTSFKRALEPEYQVVTAPGPDVLRVRTAITGVELVKPPMNPTDVIPVKFLFKAATGGFSAMVPEMSAEMEVLDAQGNRLAAAAVTRKGDQSLKQGEQVTWKELDAISSYWAKGFRQRLDELRGVPAK